MPALAVSSAESLAGYILLIWVAGPFWLAFALRLIFRVDAVTVFGRRTKAVMRFSFRKRRAREVFGWVCERTREKQAQPAPENAEEGSDESPPLEPLTNRRERG